ncbi:MAG TPA: hypothetical protein VEC60_09185 [Reyranella sp.]|nr:hypothetical protein [Reyranella sp.]
MIYKLGFAILGLSLVSAAAQAEVYCKAVGVPKGCVMRPAPVVTPGAGAPGVGVVPGAGAGAPGVGVAPGAGPGVGVNRGGPVNRAGPR